MANEHISQWLQSQGAEMQGALAGIVSVSLGETGDTIDIGWPQQATELSGFQLVSSRVCESGAPCIKPVNTDVGGEYAAIVGYPLDSSSENPGVTAFLVKGENAQIGEQALNKLRDAIPSLQQTLVTYPPAPVLESPHITQANKEAAAEQYSAQFAIERLGKLTRLMATTLSAHRFDEVSLTLATELALELQCERVSLGMRRGRKTRLEAISHTAHIKSAKPAVQACVAAMDEALDQHSTIFYPALADDSHMLSTLRHEALSNLEKQDHICTVPLMHDHDAIGALLFERPANTPFTAQDRELFDHVASFLAPLLQLKFHLGQPWYKRARIKLSHLRISLASREGLLWTLGSTALVAAIVAMAIVPLPHSIDGNAVVEGSVQRLMSSPQSGYIKDVHVRPGDTIVAGQALLELEDKDLALEGEQAKSEMRQLETAYGKALATRDRTEIAVTQAKMSEARARLELVQQQMTRTRIKAPFDGIVLEGDLTQSLGAPVEKGEQLLVLAPDLNVRLSVHIDETDIRRISKGQNGKVAFSANPGEHYEIQVSRVTPVASVSEGKNGFAVEATLINPEGDEIRPGYLGVAKLNLEPKPLLPRFISNAGDWLKFQLWRWIGEL